MSARIIDLSDALAREKRRSFHVVAPRTPLSALIGGAPFEACAAHIQPIREAVLFAISICALPVAVAAIEEFIALPTADTDARFCRDSLALGFCMALQQGARNAAEDDAAGDLLDQVANRLFPLSLFPHDPAA
jgi:hypothetical protein